MNSLKKLGLSLLTTVPFLAQAGSFEKSAQHLDTDGSFIGYMNFEGDGAEIGAKLDSIYQKILEIGTMPPIPVDYTQLIENLGFSSCRSMAASSKEIESGLHVNRLTVEINDQPKGLFSLYGTLSAPAQPFTAAALAPADANVAGCGPLDFTGLSTMVKTILVQFMGPTGEGLTDQYLTMPIPGTELTVEALIEGLSGRWDYAYKMDLSDVEAPEIQFWLQIEDNGTIVSQLKPLETSMPILFSEEANGALIADFSPLMGEDAPFGLFIEQTPEGHLAIYSSAEWTGSSDGPKLKDNASFQALRKRLPETAQWFSYSGGFSILDSIKAPLMLDPDTALYSEVILEAAEFLIGDFYKPAASAIYYQDDMLITEQYANYSIKQAVMLVPSMMMTVYPAMAIPAFNKVRHTSQEKAVQNNLRMIASASMQYFLEEGVEEVVVRDLVGPNKYIHNLNPVAGENYMDMVITFETEALSVTLEDGTVITQPMY